VVSTAAVRGVPVLHVSFVSSLVRAAEQASRCSPALRWKTGAGRGGSVVVVIRPSGSRCASVAGRARSSGQPGINGSVPRGGLPASAVAYRCSEDPARIPLLSGYGVVH